jgi:hypothetical protein
MVDHRDTTLVFPLQIDSSGGLATVSGDKAVANHMRTIIEACLYENPYEPLFGWPVQAFAPVGDADVIAELVKDAIIDWEDRIDDRSLRVTASIGDEGALQITVFYLIRNEATLRTLSHGFRVR